MISRISVSRAGLAFTVRVYGTDDQVVNTFNLYIMPSIDELIFIAGYRSQQEVAGNVTVTMPGDDCSASGGEYKDQREFGA